MKNFLAIDTSSCYMTVLAMKDGQAFVSHLPDCSMRHSVLLMDEIDGVLRRADLSLDECDFFAVAVGPGSFTGIRIGISAVKGFCLATGKPALPVTSFEEMAYNGVDGKKILCLADALHGHYYACGLQGDKRLLEPSYLEEQEVLRLVGEGYTPCAFGRLPLSEKTDVLLLDPAEGLKRAATVLSEAGRFGEPKALYIRKSQAEEENERRRAGS